MCSQEKVLQDILSPPTVVDPFNTETWTNKEVLINCSVKLQPGDTITKLVRFVGSEGSNIVFDCNGATISPLDSLKSNETALQLLSKRYIVGEEYLYNKIANVTIKNCNIEGNVRIGGGYEGRSVKMDHNSYKNQLGPEYVNEIRLASAKNIVLDNVNVENNWRQDSIYFSKGVSYSRLINSVINHNTEGLAVYIDMEAAYNVVDNNEFHSVSSNNREVLAIDAAEGNIISRNWFSGIDFGGVYLYRNCGEGGQIRYTAPAYNKIQDNIFYYSHSWHHPPAIYIASRDRENGDSFCDLDSGHAWDITDVDPDFAWDADWESSSTVDRDYARHNKVTGNKICNDDPDNSIKVNNSSFNFNNYIDSNLRISCSNSTPIPR